MFRLAALVAVLLVALSGCTPSRMMVRRGDAAAIAAADARLRGRQAAIRLVSGNQHLGRVVFVRPDSTAWVQPGGGYTVPTTDVASFRYTSRSEGTRQGTIIGTGTGSALALLALASSVTVSEGSLDALALRVLAGVWFLSGPLYGAGVGTLLGRPIEIHLVE